MRVTENLLRQDSEDFHLTLLEYKEQNKCSTYLEAIISYLEENHMEPEDLVPLLTPTMKELLRKDAEEANLLKERSTFFQTDDLF